MNEPADSGNPAAEPQSMTEPERRSRLGRSALWLGAALVVAAGAIAATPFWAPAVTRALPWGAAPPPPPAPDTALAARVAALEAAQAQAARSAATLQQLTQRLAALEARPTPDLAATQQQVTALSKAVADLTASVATLDKQAEARPGTDPNATALVLIVLQIREAVDAARPFEAEYQALAALAHDRPDIAAAAAPLAGLARKGVVTRAALAERFRRLEAEIATARQPAANDWWDIREQLRSLVTIRRVDGAGRTPAETAVGIAERGLLNGDLQGAVGALDGLTGANREAADEWLALARKRLLAETTLRQVEALMTARLGGPPVIPANPAKPG